MRTIRLAVVLALDVIAAVAEPARFAPNSIIMASGVALGLSGEAHAAQPYDGVCRGEVTKTDQPADARYAHGLWIGECFVKLDADAATTILNMCNINRPCVVKAKVADGTSRSWSGGWNKDILEVYSVKLDGTDMTCRGKLITDKNSGDVATIGQCYLVIPNRSAAATTILDNCRENHLCMVRARVVKNEITMVYSARAGR
jgi:hypothetical protein